jgi:hypothetical protein
MPFLSAAPVGLKGYNEDEQAKTLFQELRPVSPNTQGYSLN